jgi:hypothetical protein
MAGKIEGVDTVRVDRKLGVGGHWASGHVATSINVNRCSGAQCIGPDLLVFIIKLLLQQEDDSYKTDLGILDKFGSTANLLALNLAKQLDMVQRQNENLAGNMPESSGRMPFCEKPYLCSRIIRIRTGRCPRPIYQRGWSVSKIFEEPHSASKLYHYIPKIGRGVIHYVAFNR